MGQLDLTHSVLAYGGEGAKPEPAKIKPAVTPPDKPADGGTDKDGPAKLPG